MLDKLKSISIKGCYFDEEKNINLFKNETDRVSFVYGKNGSGKTSISNSFEALKNDDYSEYSIISLMDFNSNIIFLSQDEKRKIYVFNEKFIDSKIKFSDSGMSTIVMFGQQIEIEEDLKKSETDFLKLKQEYQEAEKLDQEINDETNSSSPNYYKNKIIEVLKSDNGWASREQKIKKLSRKSSVNDTIFDNISSTVYKKDIKEEMNKLNDNLLFLSSIAENKDKLPEIIFEYTIDESYEKNLLKLLRKKIEKPELTDREKTIFQLMEQGFQSNIDSANNYFKKNVQYCPYCFQEITKDYRDNLLIEFKHVLNENVEDHVNELNDFMLSTLNFDTTPYIALNNKICIEISKLIVEFNKKIEKVNEMIVKKQNNVYVPISISNLNIEKSINKINELINNLKKEVIIYNKKIENISKTIEECQNLNKIISRNEIETYLNLFKEKIKLKNDNSKKLQELKISRNNLRKIIDNLNSKKKNFDIALKKINDDLAYIFFTNDRLSVKYESEKYIVYSYGQKVPLNKLSIGERNAIALCYFFTQVLENTDETNDYCNEFFLIIDDPISSFDFENKVGVYSLLRSKLNKILVNNSSNKAVILTHEIEAMINFQKLKSEFNNISFSYFTLYNKQTKAFDKFDKNGYTQAFIMMYNYAINPTEEYDLIIGNSMRKVIEAFSTFQCKQNVESFMRDEDILNLVPESLRHYFENFMYRLVLNGESHFGDQSITFPEGNFYEYISQQEKQMTAKNLISFLYIINPVHVKKQLNNNKEYINNIMIWVEELKNINKKKENIIKGEKNEK